MLHEHLHTSYNIGHQILVHHNKSHNKSHCAQAFHHDVVRAFPSSYHRLHLA
uniref:Uncharacterized protein n=1 Tax=Arundo donax TaxID=35708 RepID=A0A0A9E7W6_ARUDO